MYIYIYIYIYIYPRHPWASPGASPGRPRRPPRRPEPRGRAVSVCRRLPFEALRARRLGLEGAWTWLDFGRGEVLVSATRAWDSTARGWGVQPWPLQPPRVRRRRRACSRGASGPAWSLPSADAQSLSLPSPLRTLSEVRKCWGTPWWKGFQQMKNP